MRYQIIDEASSTPLFETDDFGQALSRLEDILDQRKDANDGASLEVYILDTVTNEIIEEG